MNHVTTPSLHIAYEAWGDAASPKTAVLLHGWPDSARTWHAVAPQLAQAGWRVLAPELRGFGQTRFVHAQQMRSGQLSALGRDLLEFIDALQLQQPALIGHDWGARAVANACGLRPGVARALVMMSVGYGTNDPHQTMSLQQARNYWYHWFMVTPRGQRAIREERRAFTQLMWDTWAPQGWYESAEFEATAQAFDNPDWADVVLHSYQSRWLHAPDDPAYAQDTAALQPAPVLSVPTLVLHGALDPCNPPEASAGKEHFFAGRYERHLIEGAGHFPQRERPADVARHLLEFLG